MEVSDTERRRSCSTGTSCSDQRYDDYYFSLRKILVVIFNVVFHRAVFYHKNPDAAKVRSSSSSDPVVTTDSPAFPTSGWTLDKGMYPRVSGRTIYSHLSKTGKGTKSASAGSIVDRPLARGNALYFYGYVHDVEICYEGSKCYIKSKCWATQRKSAKYVQKLVLTSSSPVDVSCTVDFAVCLSCVAGADGGICSHVFAVLLVLEEEKQASDVSKTSLPCTWGPRQRNIEPEPVMDVVVEKPLSASERKKRPVSSTLYDARGVDAKRLSVADLEAFRSSLADDCPLKALMPDITSHASSDFGEVPFGSFLSYQRTKKQPSPPQPPQPVKMPALPLPTQDTSAPPGYTWPLELIEAQKLESATLGQGSNATWLEFHRSTLTASTFWRICHRQKNVESLLISMFDGPSLDTVPAIQHGRRFEDVALQSYVDAKVQAGSPVEVRRCGLALYPPAQFIGASPDGMVFDATRSPRFGLVEVKCPYTAYMHKYSIKEAAELIRDFCVTFSGGTLRLKKEHPYYWQVQGQMGVTRTQWCDFVVFVGDNTPLFVERIEADRKLWTSTILPTLQQFYTAHALPYLRRCGRRHPSPGQASPVAPTSNVGNDSPTTSSTSVTKASPFASCATVSKAPPAALSATSDTDYSRFETLLSHDECQSRLDGRNGSNACTIICLHFIHDFMQKPTAYSSDHLCQIMRAGNSAYDALNTISLLSADEAMEKVAFRAELMHEVFVSPTQDAFQSLMQDFALFSQASDSTRVGGLFVITPYTFAFCCHDNIFIVFDSHCHGHHGALLAELPLDVGAKYLQHFFAKHYRHLHYSANASSNLFAHMTFIRVCE